MDHIVSIQAGLRDRQAISAACLRLRWPPPVMSEHRMYWGKVRGLGIQAPGWQYPIVCRLESGELTHDNFDGRWGDLRRLDELKQAYAVEKTLLEARKQGRWVYERAFSDGTIQLTVELEEGAYDQADNH